MITFAAKVLSCFATTLQQFLLTASAFGYIILTVLSWVITQFLKILERVVSFFQIVYEDNITIFTEELPNSASGLYETIDNQIQYVQDCLASVYYTITYRLATVIISISWVFHTIAVIVYDLLFLLKNAIILIGDTIWLTLTFVPIQLPLLCRTLCKWISDIVVNKLIIAYMALLKVIDFLTEVPLESFVGITSAIIIVKLLVHFRQSLFSHITVLYSSLVRQMTYFYYAAFNYFFNSEVQVITRLINGEDLSAREVNFDNSEVVDNINTDSLCVICHEHQKCVLTLPCRHVCLCTDCCRRLYGYQRTCPICRRFIYHSVTIYL